MVMGFPVVPVVIMVMMTVPLIKAMAVRFRPMLMVMGMLVPVLMAVGHLRGVLVVVVGVLMVMDMFMRVCMQIAVLMVFFHCRTSFKGNSSQREYYPGYPISQGCEINVSHSEGEGPVASLQEGAPNQQPDERSEL